LKYFKKDKAFPNEAFIQEALETYFINKGYEIEKYGQIDLLASNSLNNEKWIIEAKGITSQVGLDFNTCIGQIVKSMNIDKINYAIAIPKHIKYKKQCALISNYFREKMNLNFLLVTEFGEVELIRPTEDNDLFFKSLG
jgi:hypothetical protein